MPADPARVARDLVTLRISLGARAAGVWQVDGDRLVRLAFDAADDMPVEVASAFVAATGSVPLDRHDLGIVAAVEERGRKVSVASRLAAEAGSGYWLRAFGADRSVAVPIAGADGTILGVVSVAVVGLDLSDDDVERRLRERAGRWFEPL